MDFIYVLSSEDLVKFSYQDYQNVSGYYQFHVQYHIYTFVQILELHYY
jgi:hypothetical protein